MRYGHATTACVSSTAVTATGRGRAIDAVHRSPHRDLGVPGATGRARIRVRAHLHWSCLRWPKTDRREIKAVDALWKLSSLRAVIASDLGLSRADLPGDISAVAPARCASALISRIFPAWFPYSRFVTYEVLKMTSRRLISIDRTNR